MFLSVGLYIDKMLFIKFQAFLGGGFSNRSKVCDILIVAVTAMARIPCAKLFLRLKSCLRTF